MNASTLQFDSAQKCDLVENDRKAMMVLIGVAPIAPVGALVGVAPSAATAIAVTCLVAFFTQCWEANSAALTGDILPTPITSSVFGLMGTAGSLASA